MHKLGHGGDYQLHPRPGWYKHNSKKYYITLAPGRYGLKTGVSPIPLGSLLKTYKSSTTKVIKNLCKGVQVNGKLANSINYPVVALDLIKVENKVYRVVFNVYGKYVLMQVQPNSLRYIKVFSITTIKNGKLQINGIQGSNYLVSHSWSSLLPSRTIC